MQIQRLFEITYLLLEKEIISAKELAERFEVSTRTIYRDVEILSSSGIPVHMKKGRNGGISLMPNFKLNKAVMTKEEKSVIISALHNINAFDEISLSNTISKFDAFLDENNKSFIEIDYGDWGSLIKEQFENSKKAIIDNNILEFDYVSSFNQSTHREVEPYILWFKDKTWYLKAYCLGKMEERVFRLTRMKNVQIKETKFKLRLIENKQIENEITYETIKVILKISQNMQYRILDEFSERDVVENKDNSYTVTMECYENEWLYGYILSFGAEAEVVEPPRIRNIIAKKLRENLNKYL